MSPNMFTAIISENLLDIEMKQSSNPNEIDPLITALTKNYRLIVKSSDDSQKILQCLQSLPEDLTSQNLDLITLLQNNNYQAASEIILNPKTIEAIEKTTANAFLNANYILGIAINHAIEQGVDQSDLSKINNVFDVYAILQQPYYRERILKDLSREEITSLTNSPKLPPYLRDAINQYPNQYFMLYEIYQILHVSQDFPQFRNKIICNIPLGALVEVFTIRPLPKMSPVKSDILSGGCGTYTNKASTAPRTPTTPPRTPTTPPLTPTKTPKKPTTAKSLDFKLQK